jgi:hypothetical protein
MAKADKWLQMVLLRSGFSIQFGGGGCRKVSEGEVIIY